MFATQFRYKIDIFGSVAMNTATLGMMTEQVMANTIRKLVDEVEEISHVVVTSTDLLVMFVFDKSGKFTNENMLWNYTVVSTRHIEW